MKLIQKLRNYLLDKLCHGEENLLRMMFFKMYDVGKEKYNRLNKELSFIMNQIKKHIEKSKSLNDKELKRQERVGLVNNSTSIVRIAVLLLLIFCINSTKSYADNVRYRIGTTGSYYQTLQEAVNHLSSNGKTINVYSRGTYQYDTGEVNINYNVTLNLNGQTITRGGTDSIIVNNGKTLTITSSSAGGTIRTRSTTANSIQYLIRNEGILNINSENVTIEHKGYQSSTTQYWAPIYNRGKEDGTSNCRFNFSAGKIYTHCAQSCGDNTGRGILNYYDALVNITGGTIVMERSCKCGHSFSCFSE